MMKIDVVCVTKNHLSERWYRNLDFVPLCHLIVERSTPLGHARMRSIEKVDSEFFAFIDDDVIISKGWFAGMINHIKPDVGAIEGREIILGLGKYGERVNRNRQSRPNYEIKKGHRGICVNTLIRTSLVKDWKPSCELNAFEDYELTQHVINKGFKWMSVKGATAYHPRPWSKVFNAGVRDYRNFKKIHSWRNQLRMLVKLAGSIVCSYSPLYHFFTGMKPTRRYTTVQNMGCIVGLMS